MISCATALCERQPANLREQLEQTLIILGTPTDSRILRTGDPKKLPNPEKRRLNLTSGSFDDICATNVYQLPIYYQISVREAYASVCKI